MEKSKKINPENFWPGLQYDLTLVYFKYCNIRLPHFSDIFGKWLFIDFFTGFCCYGKNQYIVSYTFISFLSLMFSYLKLESL